MPPDGAKSWYWLWRVMSNLPVYVGYEYSGTTLYLCDISSFARRELNWEIDKLLSDLEQTKEPISISQTSSGPVRNFNYTQITHAQLIRKRIEKLEKRLVKCQRIK